MEWLRKKLLKWLLNIELVTILDAQPGDIVVLKTEDVLSDHAMEILRHDLPKDIKIWFISRESELAVVHPLTEEEVHQAELRARMAKASAELYLHYRRAIP